MRIGFARYSQSCDIDFYNASSRLLGCELRVGLLEALVKLGHQVVILSKVPDEQEWLFYNPERHPVYDYDWLNDVAYLPSGAPPDDLDLFIVENSTTNAFYGGDNLLRFAEVLKALHDTTCVVYQHADVTDAIAVPLSRIYNAVADPNLAEVNLKNIFAGTEMNGNRWVIWSHANNDTAVMGAKGNNVSYHRWSDKHIGFPLGYSENFDRPLAFYKPEDMVDIIYVGGEKSEARTNRLLELAGTGSCCKRVLFGRWKNPPAGWYYGGPIEGHGRAYNFLPMGRCTVSVSDKWIYESGQLTTRLTMAVRAGIMSFADSQWNNLDAVLGKGAQIESHEQIHEFLPQWREVAEAQRLRLKTWTEIYDNVLKNTILDDDERPLA